MMPVPPRQPGARPMPGPGRFIPAHDLRALRESPLAALVQVAGRYGDLFQYPVGFWTIYVVNQPAYIKHVLQDNQRNYSKLTFQYNLLGLVAGQGLLSSDGAAWLRQRRLAQPAFHRERVAALGALVTDATARMLGRWERLPPGQPLDLDAEMMHLTLAIVGQALFRSDLSSNASDLARSALTALDYVAYRGRMPFAPPLAVPTPGNRRVRRALRTLDEAIHALIAQRRRALRDEGDLLSMLLLTEDAETGERMSDRQIRDEMMTFLIAGHETVASAMTWVWYLLATHPAKAALLRAELVAALGGRPPGVADLPQLPYTAMVVDEALRLYPPAWLMTRRALAADQIDGYAIPANALIVLSPYLTQRHPAHWPEPERFEPERFEPAQAASRPRFAYFPFGGGPHLCIGNQFALLEARLILAAVAQRYELALPPGHQVAVEPLVTLRPRHGLPMLLRRIQKGEVQQPPRASVT